MQACAIVLLQILALCTASYTGIDEEPNVFGLLSLTDPNEYRIFFNSMKKFKQIGATKLLYFLTIGKLDIYDYFLPTNATCIANSSYCYITRRLPELPQDVCSIGVTLRIHKINHDFCLPNQCPNIHDQQNCQLRVQMNTKKCRKKNWPFGPCPYPQELARFLPPQSMYSTHEMSNKNMTRDRLSSKENAKLLAFGFATAIVAILLALFFLLMITMKYLRREKRVIVLVPIDFGEFGNEPFEFNVDDKQALLRLPSRKEIEQVMQMPHYSLASVAMRVGR